VTRRSKAALLIGKQLHWNIFGRLFKPLLSTSTSW